MDVFIDGKWQKSQNLTTRQLVDWLQATAEERKLFLIEEMI